jgi:sugar O-acyltransferase (sialic acid O-acetyltransferase NeuD family)
MIIIGAGGHAIEVLDIIKIKKNIVFFDSVSTDKKKLFSYPIIHSKKEAVAYLAKDKRFILGLGNGLARYKMTDYFKEIGGVLTSIISNKSFIGSQKVSLGRGVNVMHHVFISSDVRIGEGVLVNASSNIHHGVVVEDFVEIAPQAVLLGSCSVGKFSMIGAGVVILPNVHVGENVLVGAGSVVTRDLENNAVYTGNPAKKLKSLPPLIMKSHP